MGARLYIDTVDIDLNDREEWMERAACVNIEDATSLFFPENRKSTTEAKQVCLTKCSVRMQCLAKALQDEKTGDRRWGVFGGMNPTERKELQAKLDALKEAS